MLNKAAVALASAAAFGALPAEAQITTIYTSNVLTMPSSTTATVFESFNGSAGAFSGAANAIAKESATSGNGGTVARVSTGVPFSGFGTALRLTDTKNGLGNDPQMTVDFVGAVHFFSFIIGNFNGDSSVTFNFTNGPSQTLKGAQIVNGPAASLGTSGRVSYHLGALNLDNVVFRQSGGPGNSFVIDELASAAPEPAAWAFMIFGFGAVGTVLRGRRSRQRQAVA